MDEEYIYVVTRWRIRYPRESDSARQDAINHVLAHEANDDYRIVAPRYSAERCKTKLGDRS